MHDMDFQSTDPPAQYEQFDPEAAPQLQLPSSSVAEVELSLVHEVDPSKAQLCEPYPNETSKSKEGDAKALSNLSARSTKLVNVMQSSRRLTIILPKRWLLVIMVSLLNFSNTLSWIAYAPVGNYVNYFYGENAAAWIATVFIIVAAPFSFAGMWIGSATSLKTTFLCAAVPSAMGSLIRWFSSLSQSEQEFRYNTIIIGQIIAAISYPFLMFLPSKVSDTWFPPSERTIATTIGVMANPLGVMVANLVSPWLVQSSRDVWILNSVLFGMCTLAMVVVFIGLSFGNTKRCGRIDIKTRSYTESFKKCFTSRTYIILLISLGGGIGMFNSLYAMMLQMMCPTGHNNFEAGVCAALMIGTGIFGASVASIIVDKKGYYKQVMMISICAASMFGIAFIWMTLVEGWNGTRGLYIFAALLGGFGLAAYPVGLELAMECTYPVASEVSSGFIVLSGQIFSLVFIYIVKYFAVNIPPNDPRLEIQVCRAHANDESNAPMDYFVAMIIISVVAAFFGFIILFINPTYVRSDSDHEKRPHMTKTEANDFLDLIAGSTEANLYDPLGVKT